MPRIQDVLDRLTPAGSLAATVDTLVIGNPGEEVRGIAVTYMATQAAIERAASLGANLLISHEGLFYSHRSDGKRLEADPVVRQKKRLLEEIGLAVFRYHDGIHRESPDGITAGLIEELGWQDAVSEHRQASALLKIPAATLEELAALLKRRLKLSYIRFVGNPAKVCRKVGVLVGYRGGGELAIPLMSETDVIIAGEGPEWEAPEYVRDAVYQGREKAMILLGHGPSEAPGMKRLALRLREAFPSIPVHVIENEPLFQWR
ncbi:Nif3-like dinuclear metal center hexameric protein [uncultured Paenibacillus sp.]|uniref:Nif3-like dinuclear metal center hexameric protein n=1 Tax=uncultured Paenibacillus sp. TaxID=227322 RepID=UPI0015AAAE60|nr:Nif3-like dinuclear metal center hexameric protein [uncultured Paenibacillus sp.]